VRDVEVTVDGWHVIVLIEARTKMTLAVTVVRRSSSHSTLM
jgi:hypothetical protein